MTDSNPKPWSGRFSGSTDELMERFNASIGFDRRLFRHDIAGSRAQARALELAGILTETERDAILAGLDQVEEELAAGSLPLPDSVEDIHMAVEKRLTEIVGPAGGKLHTGRSRNDQVALDERLYMKEALCGTVGRIVGFQQVLVAFAEEQLDVILPGYTHLQQAQPVRLSHYTMALFWMLERDRERFADCGRRADAMPLGSGALAGSGFPIDREAVADELGFAKITENSLDAVSDRDFLLEYLAASSILMTHLSRFCEDLIIWSSSEFGFVELDDAFSTGSSMLPQKKNPDSLELIRGKSGRVFGNLMALLTVMKGVPLSYSKDLQEDKEPVFDTVDAVWMSLEVFAGAWGSMSVRKERMSAALDSTILATDLADYLVQKGLPFRESHHIIGELVKTLAEQGKRFIEVDEGTLYQASELFGPDALDIMTPEASAQRRSLPGGTGRESVVRQIEKAHSLLGGG